MNIIEKTLKILELDADFIVKNKTLKSKELTAYDIIATIIEDGGNTKVSELFRGHDATKIREAFKLVFFMKPKPSPATEWYLHILSLHGLKKCPACENIKPLEEFAQNKAMKSSKYDSWCKVCTKEYREVNSTSIAKTKSDWQKDNSSTAAAATAKRRAAKKQAVPSWSDLDAIKVIYDRCPEGYQVDHWAPLQGNSVCGLHVVANLQYLKTYDNISKSNNFSDSDVFYGTTIS